VGREREPGLAARFEFVPDPLADGLLVHVRVSGDDRQKGHGFDLNPPRYVRSADREVADLHGNMAPRDNESGIGRGIDHEIDQGTDAHTGTRPGGRRQGGESGQRVIAHECGTGRVVLTVSGNSDAWLASDAAVVAPR